MPPRLVQVPYAAIGHAWPEAEQYLRRAYDRMGGDTPARMRERLANREADLWCIYDGRDMLAAALTSVRGDKITIDIIGGSAVGLWVHLLGEFENLARCHGKSEIEIEGRPGWRRFLAGYHAHRIVYRRTL